MSKKGILTRKMVRDICQKYKEGLVPMGELAKEYKVSRQAIWKALRRGGIDTAKQKVEEVPSAQVSTTKTQVCVL